MGCDIHMYVEYKPKNVDDPFNKGNWQSFGRKFNPGRHYNLFAALAGVRRGDGDQSLLYPLRGYPADAGYAAACDNYLYVTDNKYGDEGGNTCNRATAEAWVISGASKFLDDKRNHVTHPDWHSHSWLTDYELEKVFNSLPEDTDQEYWALLAAMHELERRGNDTRVVFWFDN